MASAQRGGKKTSRKQDKNNKGLSDTQRWVAGALVFTFGLFLMAAVVSYYFSWPADQNFVRWGDIHSPEGGTVTNHTGKTGAILAHYIVGEWFGVFGVAIPVVLLILGLRIINYRPAALRRSVRISLLIMIAGSLTLGFLFGTNWAVFGTGLGGAHGIVVSRWIMSFLGTVGTAMLLLLLWVLIGVYINSRRTISAVNKMGKGLYNGSVKVGGAVVGHAAEIVTGKVDDILGGLDDTGGEYDPDEQIKKEYTTQSGNLHSDISGDDKGISTVNDLYHVAASKRDNSAVKDASLASNERAPEGEPVQDDFEIRDSRTASEDLSTDGAGDLASLPDVIVLGGSSGSVRNGDGRPHGSGVPGINLESVHSRRVVELGEPVPWRGATPGVDTGDVGVIDTRYAGGVGEFAEGFTRETAAAFPHGESNVFTIDGPAVVGGMETESGGIEIVGGQISQSGNFVPSRPTAQPDGLEVLGGEDTVSGGSGLIELGSAPLSVGGVVESVTVGGTVSADDALQVVMAGRKDVQLTAEEIDDRLYDPTLELSKYQKPPVELLEDHSIDVQVTEEEIYENKNRIVRTLENFGIKIDKIKATIGPTVTLYEIVPAAGVKISKIKNLEDDIALSLKALGIRIIAPMPGKGTVGIEVPNKDKEVVSMYSVVRTMKFQESRFELPVVLGKTISNETFVIDLAKMPHLLVAGATGQGKSVGLNAIITSLLYRKHPAELKFVLVDPKRVELSLYGKLERHFLAKMESENDAILTDTQKVVYTLNALCTEMSDRYELLRMAEVKKLSEYNEKFLKRRLNPRKGHRFMPYIVVVIDEFADMIMTAGREVEAPITRLAQLARAVGIHLVIATQRPDVKVITGLIKANFPARIAFRVMSMVDSRTIIDQPGANQLIGRGDMLMSLNGELTRVQCAFIDTPEIERITEFISDQKGYGGPYELPDYQPDADASASKAADLGKIDDMFEDVARFVVQNQQGSTSSIQRRFSIGYNRAGRIMDQLEAAGIVGRAEGSKPREVLITDVASLEFILGRLDTEGL